MRGMWVCLSVLLCLVGCKKEVAPTSAPTAEASEATSSPRHPVLIGVGVDIVPIIEARAGELLGPRSGLQFPEHYTASVSLYRREVVFKRGTIVVERTDGGDIYRVSIHSGSGPESCGDGKGLLAAADAVLSTANRPTLSEAEAGQVNAALAKSDGFAEFQRDGMLVRAMGGCVKMVLLKGA